MTRRTVAMVKLVTGKAKKNLEQLRSLIILNELKGAGFG